METWKSPPGYQGLYEISTYGRIKSKSKTIYQSNGHPMTFPSKILKPELRANGYLYVMLCKNGKRKTYKISRLVAQTFIPNPVHLPIVNHKDENKLNNCVDNLEWCTQKYNVNYSIKKHPQRLAALNKRLIAENEKRQKQIVCMNETGEVVKTFSSLREASRKLHISLSSISRCLHNELKTAGGYKWKTIDAH
jgi:hypothetical protein